MLYQTNRNDDGVGSYFIPQDINQINTNPFTIFYIYNVLFTLIIKIVVIQMVGGIIVDNFAKLRDLESDMVYDINNVCSICGNKRVDIEKIYDKYGKTYIDHIKNDHAPINYVFYIYYLSKKDNTEFTGMESFVYNLVFNEKDITWFPENK